MEKETFATNGWAMLMADIPNGTALEDFKANIEAQIGQWHRVCKPLDAAAAAIVMGVKGMVPRAKFVSEAIVAEAERRAKTPPPLPTATPKKKRGVRGVFMRLTLADDAYWTVRPMENAVFREFVSAAIMRAAKKIPI